MVDLPFSSVSHLAFVLFLMKLKCVSPNNLRVSEFFLGWYLQRQRKPGPDVGSTGWLVGGATQQLTDGAFSWPPRRAIISII